MNKELRKCRLCGREIWKERTHWISHENDSLAYCDRSPNVLGLRYHEPEEKENLFDMLYKRML